MLGENFVECGELRSMVFGASRQGRVFRGLMVTGLQDYYNLS